MPLCHFCMLSKGWKRQLAIPALRETGHGTEKPPTWRPGKQPRRPLACPNPGPRSSPFCEAACGHGWTCRTRGSLEGREGWGCWAERERADAARGRTWPGTYLRGSRPATHRRQRLLRAASLRMPRPRRWENRRRRQHQRRCFAREVCSLVRAAQACQAR